MPTDDKSDNDKITQPAPCPFCPKGQGQVEGPYTVGHEYALRYYVMCHDCMAKGAKSDTKQGAIDNWNTRPIEDALQAIITAQEEEIAVLNKYCEDVAQNRETYQQAVAENKRLREATEEALEQLRNAMSGINNSWSGGPMATAHSIQKAAKILTQAKEAT